MEEIKLGLVEARFADIIWNNEPLSTRKLVALCEQELNWKRTTTYTVLKKLCDRGIFIMNDKQVTSLISTPFIIMGFLRFSFFMFLAPFKIEKGHRLMLTGGPSFCFTAGC